MKSEHLDQANAIQEKIEAHEDFISNCDYFIRNVGPMDVPVVDRWLDRAVREGVIGHGELKTLFTDMRDVVTTRLADLDKQMEAL